VSGENGGRKSPLKIEKIRRISTLNSFVNEIHSKLKAFADFYNLFGLLGLGKCDSPFGTI